MKKYYSFLVCVLISFGIWVVHNLSQTTSDVVSVQVMARSNIEGHSQYSSSPVTITARCRATGFRLVRLERRGRKPSIVFFDPDILQVKDENTYILKTSELYRYSASVFGEGVVLESPIGQELSFRFPVESGRKVPVSPIRTVSYRDQFMPVGDMVLSPDSVMIYGDPKLIASVDRVLTKPFSIPDVHSNVEGQVKLEKLRGVRFSISEVTYSQEVARYTEISAQLPVTVRNLPKGRALNIYPVSCSVVFYCKFPLLEDPLKSATLYVDYNEFADSINGKCVVCAETDCDGIIDVRITPEVCDCFEIVQ